MMQTQTTIGTLLPMLQQAATLPEGAGIGLTTDLVNDLGFDSIGLLTLAFLLEEAFGIDIASLADEYRGSATVGDLLCFVNAHGQA